MSGKSKIVFTVLVTFSVTCILFTAILGRMGVGTGDFSRLRAVADIIDRSYIGEFDREEAEDAAIDAYVSSIGDPYSMFYDSSSASTLKNSVDGEYVGIGIEIFSNPSSGELVIMTVYDGSPAMKAGVHSGDILVAVDGTAFNAETIDEAVKLMKGGGLDDPAGTKLTVTVKRGGELIDLPMTREKVELYKISTKTVGDNILYIRYSGFSKTSAKSLGKIVENAGGKYSGLVLDLRENPGGDLDAAIDICDMFLDDGLIMYTEDKYGNRNESFASSGSCALPMAVLVDGGSASASEVVAGCLQARDRAVIIGEKTYGKGVSQMIYSVGMGENADLVKVTGYKNYRPDDIWLDEGVTPDIEAKTNITINEYGLMAFDADGDEPLSIAVRELSLERNNMK